MNRKRVMTPKAMLVGVSIMMCAALGTKAQADLPPPSDYCNNLLPVAVLNEVLGDAARGVYVRTTRTIREDDQRCNRIYTIDGDIFSDGLIMLVSPARDAAAARSTVERIAREAEGSFGLERPKALGVAAVQFIRPDPLSSGRVEFNVTFALDDKVIELKYQNVDDGKLNKFMYSASDVLAIARRMATLLPDG